MSGLAGGAARGAAWNVLTVGFSKGVLLLTTVVLARILRPEDFGLLALALLVVLYLDVLGDIGVGAAVIYRRESDQESADRTASTAVAVAAATGCVLTSLAVLGAPLVSASFDEPRLTGLVQVIALSFLLRMLGVVHRSKLEKELDFARRAVPEISGAVVKGGLSIALAVGGAGVYSLAWGQVAGAGATTCLFWAMARWRFRPAFDTVVARDLLRFGVPITVLGLLTAVISTTDQLIIGARLDAEALGQYSIAYRLPELFVLQVCLLISGALFPAYAMAAADPERLRRGFRSALRLVSIFTVPLGVGLAITAPDLVPVVFGQQWQPAVPVMQLLALGATLRSLTFNVGDVYKAVGRVGVLNRLGLLYLVLLLPTLWLVAPAGIVAVALGVLGLSAAMTVLRFVIASRLMQVPLSGIAADLRPSVTAAAVMGAAVAGARLLLDDASAGARLTLVVVVGVLVYSGALALFSRATLQQVLAVGRGALSSRPTESVDADLPG